jgi:hypothetical protein
LPRRKTGTKAELSAYAGGIGTPLAADLPKEPAVKANAERRYP